MVVFASNPVQLYLNYYILQISSQEKMAQKLSNLNKAIGDQVTQATPKKKKVDGKTSARSHRATQRRQATHYYDIDDVQYLQLSVITNLSYILD